VCLLRRRQHSPAGAGPSVAPVATRSHAEADRSSRGGPTIRAREPRRTCCSWTAPSGRKCQISPRDPRSVLARIASRRLHRSFPPRVRLDVRGRTPSRWMRRQLGRARWQQRRRTAWCEPGASFGRRPVAILYPRPRHTQHRGAPPLLAREVLGEEIRELATAVSSRIVCPTRRSSDAGRASEIAGRLSAPCCCTPPRKRKRTAATRARSLVQDAHNARRGRGPLIVR
jgi:hypothetical protein